MAAIEPVATAHAESDAPHTATLPEPVLSIGQQVKNFRETKGWSQQQLADKCDVAKSTIERLEKDNPVPRMIKKILDRLEQRGFPNKKP